VLHEICTGLAEVPYYVAWSKNLVEVHDPLFSSISTGYQEICLLVENLQQSAVILDRAQHTAASRQIFAVREVAETVPLYVIYIFSIVSASLFLPHIGDIDSFATGIYTNQRFTEWCCPRPYNIIPFSFSDSRDGELWHAIEQPQTYGLMLSFLGCTVSL
jgi:hypothetical protein